MASSGGDDGERLLRQEVLDRIPNFVAEVLVAVKGHGIPVDRYYLDHVCYRVSSEEEYQLFVSALQQVGHLLIESEIGGRLISTFKLAEPIKCTDKTSGDTRAVDVIELPSPKPGSFYLSGLEHAEFVITGTLEDFEASHPTVVFDRKGFVKPLNRDLRLELGEAMCCKFHEQSLEDVIKQEKACLGVEDNMRAEG